MKAFNSELFAQRLITKRGARVSLRTAAKAIGISAPTLSRLETQKTPPQLDTFYACCQWLGLEMDFFFN